MLSNRPRDKWPESAVNQSKVCLYLGLIKRPQGQRRPGSSVSSLLSLLTEQPGCCPSPLVTLDLVCPCQGSCVSSEKPCPVYYKLGSCFRKQDPPSISGVAAQRARRPTPASFPIACSLAYPFGPSELMGAQTST